MLTPGTILQQNRYRIEAVLGQGGMGAVYRAWHLGLEKHVAVKELVPQPELATQRLDQLRVQFKREAVTLARLDHPNLVRVLDSFEEDGRAYLVMDLVEGESLADRIRRLGRLSETEVVTWTRALLDALVYCHAQGVFHRDIKPHNIIICPDGRAILVDFGLVKLWDPEDPRTQSVMRGLGTPEYAPPEQYDTYSHTDGRSDLYGLGATLYHALSGESPPTVTQRVVNPEALRPLQRLVPDLNPKLADIVMRTLELRPTDRFQSATEMLATLEGELPASSATERATTIVMPTTQSSAVLSPAASLYKTKVLLEATVRMPSATESAETPKSKPQRSRPFWKRLGKGHIAVVIIGVLAVAALWGLLGDRARGIQSTKTAVPTTVPATVVTKVAELLVPEPTAIPTEVAASPTPELPPMRIGLVTAAGSVDDGGFNQSAWNGVQEAGRVYGAEVDLIETENPDAYVHNIGQFAEAGFDVIVTVGYTMREATIEMAHNYPETFFIGVDQDQDVPIANLAGLVFREDHMGQLAGVLAANLTQNRILGVVLGSAEVPQMIEFYEGYIVGAASVDAGIRIVHFYYPGELATAFVDPEWGMEIAAQLVEMKADVIYAAAGLTGNGALIETAGYDGMYCIGVDMDQWETVPEARPCLVSSTIKQIDVGIFELVALAAAGEFPGGNHYGGVGLAPFHDFDESISPELKAQLQELETQLREEARVTESDR